MQTFCVSFLSPRASIEMRGKSREGRRRVDVSKEDAHLLEPETKSRSCLVNCTPRW